MGFMAAVRDGTKKDALAAWLDRGREADFGIAPSEDSRKATGKEKIEYARGVYVAWMCSSGVGRRLLEPWS